MDSSLTYWCCCGHRGDHLAHIRHMQQHSPNSEHGIRVVTRPLPPEQRLGPPRLSSTPAELVRRFFGKSL